MGSRRWQVAVAQATGLSRREKALCNALLPYLNWDSGEAAVSISRLASESGWSERALQYAATSLSDRGVLCYPDGRRGGRRSDGGGIANRVRLDLSALENLKGARRAPLKGANGNELGCKPRPARVQTTADKGAPGAPEQLREQPNRTTTTTTTRESGGGGGGGGGAGGSLGGAGGEPEETKIKETAATVAPASPEHDPAESRRLLLNFGVSASKARTLAPLHSPDVIKAGISWVREHSGGNTQSKPGLLVTILTDGTALEAWRAAVDRRQAAEAALKAAEALQRRCVVLAHVIRALQQSEDQSIRAEADRRLREIFAVWPTLKDLALAEVIPDELLFVDDVDATAVVDAAYTAAARFKESGGAPSPHTAPALEAHGTCTLGMFALESLAETTAQGG